MARKHKFHDNSRLCFVTFTFVNWIDAFIREENRNIFYESVKYCRENKGLGVYSYCIMTSHIHMIIDTENGNLSDIVRCLKSFTSRQIRKNLKVSTSESRREWILWMFGWVGEKNERNIDYQFWMQHNHPIGSSCCEMTIQRLNYMH